jgi:hypothetical protein
MPTTTKEHCYKCCGTFDPYEHDCCPNCYGGICEGCGYPREKEELREIDMGDGDELWCLRCLHKRLRGGK